MFKQLPNLSGCGIAYIPFDLDVDPPDIDVPVGYRAFYNLVDGWRSKDPSGIVRRVDFAGSSYRKTVTIATFAVDQDDLDLGEGSFFRISASVAVDITGFVNGIDGRELVLLNVGTKDITLKDQNPASAAENRIIIGRSLKIKPDDIVTLIYDAVDLRWRLT